MEAWIIAVIIISVFIIITSVILLLCCIRGNCSRCCNPDKDVEAAQHQLSDTHPRGAQLDEDVEAAQHQLSDTHPRGAQPDKDVETAQHQLSDTHPRGAQPDKDVEAAQHQLSDTRTGRTVTRRRPEDGPADRTRSLSSTRTAASFRFPPLHQETSEHQTLTRGRSLPRQNTGTGVHGGQSGWTGQNIHNGQSFAGRTKVAEVREGGKTIDLHGLSLNCAMIETQRFVKKKENEYFDSGFRRQKRFFYIITGQGLHSKDGIPVVKPNVENFLKGNGYQYEFTNPGKIKVDLRNRRRHAEQTETC